MDGFWLFVIIVFFAAVGGLASKVAGEKGYSGLAWFFIGGLLAPLGLFAAIGLPDKRLRELLKETRRSSPEEEQPSSQPERMESPSTGEMKPFIAIAGTILVAILMFVLLIPRILD